VGAIVVVLLAAIAGWVFVARPWSRAGDGPTPAIPGDNGAPVSVGAGRPSAAVDTGDAKPSGWIVLSWAPKDEVLALWLLSPDGEKRIRLTSPDGKVDTEPVFSPDARRIAFVRAEQGFARQSDLWVCDVRGGNARPIVAAGSESERLMSPVWLSNDRILFTRKPTLEETSAAEVCQVGVGEHAGSGGEMSTPELLFRFGGNSSDETGLVTDVAADGSRLLVVAGRPGQWASSDVLIADLQGNRLNTVWEDEQSEFRDSRALWSPSGERIAWQHQFAVRPVRIGIGWAVSGTGAEWDARLQPAGRVPVIMPVTWHPDGGELLCVRIYGTPPDSLRAAFFLVGKNFEVTDRVFELPGGRSIAAQRHSGRLGDWALVPADVVLPSPSE
jgi:hypothetical protein